MRFKVSRRVFAHIDCDSFFASCEILRNPKLRNKPVMVGREIVIASNYEAKSLGIKTGTPIWEAERILGKYGYFFPVDITYYTKISDMLMFYLKENTLLIEEFSIDEAFCEITGLAQMNKMSLEDYLFFLQKDILEKIGIPVSIGVSNTRIKAKIFSKINKPYGIYIGIDKDKEIEKFKTLELAIIPFIGKSYQKKLKYRCKTVYDFLKLGYRYLKENIGKNATDLWLELAGVNSFVVKKSKEIKSMSRSRSFNDNITNNKAYIQKQLLINFSLLYNQLIDKNFEVKQVSIMFRYKDFETIIFDYKFGEYINKREYLLEKVLFLFENNYNSSKSYRSTGVIFSKLRNYLPRQMSIFDKPIKSRDNYFVLSKTINNINKKYGITKIGYGNDLLGKNKEAMFCIRK